MEPGAGVEVPLSLTLSVGFLTVGVAERGRSRIVEVVRVGSELFWVIWSMKARTSDASPVSSGCFPPALTGLFGRGASGRESRSSRNWRASCCLDFDFDFDCWVVVILSVVGKEAVILIDRFLRALGGTSTRS